MSLLGEVILDRADPSPREEGWCKPRARKVTITEIIDSCGNSSGGSDNDDDCGGRDSGDSAFDEKGGCAAAGDEAVAAQDADEVFKELDGLVQDWKVQLEVIVGEGLKKLRRNGKEKKAMMKYLPGEDGNNSSNKRLVEARAEILREWKTEFGRTLAVTLRRIDKLNSEASRKTEDVIETKILGHPQRGTDGVMAAGMVQQNKKTIVNLEFDSCDGYGSLKQLTKDLEAICSLFAAEPGKVKSEIPIYGGNSNSAGRNVGEINKKSNSNVLIDQLGKVGRQLPPLKGEQPGCHVLGKRKVKSEKRETHVHKAQRKMLERSQGKQKLLQQQQLQSGGKYRVLQLRKSNGKGERYLVVKRKAKSASRMRQEVEAEEIFKEWIGNLEMPAEKKRVAMKKRTRKMSHRSKRRMLLKEKEKAGSMLYANVVKKNLKPANADTSAEDIFEAWRSNLDVKAPAQKKTEGCVLQRSSSVDFADIFKVWRHNLKSERAYGKRRRTGLPPCPSEEEILATARFFQKELRLAEDSFFPRSPEVPEAAKGGLPEEIFYAWRHNLDESICARRVAAAAGRRNGRKPGRRSPEPENAFHDWLHNFADPVSWPDSGSSSSSNNNDDRGLPQPPEPGNGGSEGGHERRRQGGGGGGKKGRKGRKNGRRN